MAGLLCGGGIESGSLKDVVTSMADALVHRGPDDGGVWVDKAVGVALGHRRLSILDLSVAGHQPMVSPSGRFVMTFNGEIYNHLELRDALDRHGAARLTMTREGDCHAPSGLAMTWGGWRGHSDTETLLAGSEQWGVEATLKRAVGMFAMALWDRNERVLYLARDRFGEKPLFYGWVDCAFVFGSELRALWA